MGCRRVRQRIKDNFSSSSSFSILENEEEEEDKDECAMNQRNLTGQRLLALFVAGCLALNYPLLALFATDRLFWGIPILYIYIFISWLVLIVLLAVVIERR
jgi:hypothetical protein